MSGSAHYHQDSVQNKFLDQIDLTDERDDAPAPSTSFRPVEPQGHLHQATREPVPSRLATELPTFPQRVQHTRASPQEQQTGHSLPAVSSHNDDQTRSGAAGPSFARSRQGVLDQSAVAVHAIFKHALQQQTPQQPFRSQGEPVSGFDRAVNGGGSSLRIQSTTHFSYGPPPVKTFQSRYAPAIAGSSAAAPRPRPYPEPGQPAHRSLQPPSDRHKFGSLSQPRPAPTIIARGVAQTPETAPRANPLPPGFAHAAPSGFAQSFHPAPDYATEQYDPHALRTDHDHALDGSIDLTRDDHSPAPPARQPFSPANPSSSSDMSRPTKATPIVPTDPSARIRHGAGGAGWTTAGFDDDGDEDGTGARMPTPAQSKGKGRATTNFSGGRSEKQALDAMKSYKTTPSTVPANSFHAAPHASSSRGTSNAVAGPSSGRLSREHVIHQDDPQTSMEMAGQAKQKLVAREQKKSAAAAAKRKPANGGARGRGKKKEPEVIELSESDSDDDDEIVDGDSDDDSGLGSGVGPGGRERQQQPQLQQARTSIAVKGVARAQQQNRYDEADQPSSDDPIAIGSRAPRGEPGRDRDRERRMSDVADGILPGGVGKMVAEYERRTGGKAPTGSGSGPSIAKSLKGKTKPRVDGGPTDGGEMDDVALTPAAPKKMPRAAQASMANGKGKGKSKESSMLGEMATIGFEAYLVGRTAVPPDYASARYSLILNTRGNPDLHKLTVRRHVSGQEDDFECEIFVKDLTSIGFSDALNEEALPHIEFVFSNKDAHAKAVFDKLAEPCEIPDDELDQHTVIFFFREAPTPGWKEEGVTPMDALFRTCAMGWGGTPVALRKAVANKRMFDTRKHQVDELDHVVEKRASGRKAKGKRAAPDPHQPKLSFGPAQVKAPRLRQDGANDWIENEQGPRRSGRASTSTFASAESQQRAAERDALTKPRSVSPHAPEEVVLEYPMNEPGAVSVTWGDTKRLRDEEFLNDTLIEFGLKRIMKQIEERDQSLPDHEKLAPQIHVFNSFFYKQLSTRKTKNLDPYSLVEKWTKRVDLFKKKYIVVPVNEYLHWYLAIIVNPRAILTPPPPAPPPAPPRKSGRKRTSTTDSDFVADSPGGSPEVTSKHFGGVGRSLREEDPGDLGAEAEEEEDEQAEQVLQEKVQREFQANEERKERRDRQERDEAAAVRDQIAQVKAQTAGPSAPCVRVDDVQLDSDDEVILASAQSSAQQQQDGAVRSTIDDDDEGVRTPSSVSPPPPAQADTHMRAHDDMSEDDEDVRRVRPEVEGGGHGKPSKHVAISPSQGHHTRFADDDDDILVEPQADVTEPAAAAAPADDSDDTLASPDTLGKPKQRLRRGTRKDTTAPQPAAGLPAQITLDDEDDESVPTAGDAALASVPMDKRKSSTSTSTSTSSTPTGSAAPAHAPTDELTTTRSAPAAKTCGSSSTAGRAPKPVSATPTPFAPMDPEPGRQEELARQREEEEARRRARAESDGIEVQTGKKAASADDCWILTFDSLGGAHLKVANVLRDYLGREAEAKLGIKETSHKQALAAKVEVPQQPNSCDCGLYLLHFVETFFKNPQLFLDTIVSSHGVKASSDKGKKKEVITQAFDLWQGTLAQQKRATMRADVERLRLAWQEEVGPLREKQRQEREERKRQRALEKEAQRNREAAERADAYKTEPHERRETSAQDGSAHEAEAPPARRHAPGTPPPPPSSKNKGKARASKQEPERDTLDLVSDDQSSTAGSPVKARPRKTTTPTAPPRDEQHVARGPPPRQEQPPAPQPAALDSTHKRKRATYSDQPAGPSSTSAQPEPPHLDTDAPFSFVSRPEAQPQHIPAARPESQELGVLDPQELSQVESPARSDAARPKKKAKTRHSSGDNPFPLPGGINQYGTTSDEDELADSDGDDGDEAKGGPGAAAALSQELRAPTPPPPAQASNFGPPTRSKVKAGTEMMVIDD